MNHRAPPNDMRTLSIDQLPNDATVATPAYRLPPLSWARTILTDLSRIKRDRFVLYFLIVNSLKVRYQRSTLGFLWALLNPVLMLTVLAIVFGQIIGRDIPDYPIYLFGGLIPFFAFNEALLSGSRSLITAEPLIRRTPIHKLVFPLASVSVAAVNLLATMAALLVVFLVLGAEVHVQLVLLPVAAAAMLVFSFGTALIAMTVVTYFRDFEHILSVFLRALYFASPVILMPHQLGKYAIVMDLNPLTYFLKLFRCALYDGQWPAGHVWLIVAASAIASILLGYVLFKRFEHDFDFRL